MSSGSLPTAMLCDVSAETSSWVTRIDVDSVPVAGPTHSVA